MEAIGRANIGCNRDVSFVLHAFKGLKLEKKKKKEKKAKKGERKRKNKRLVFSVH